MEPLFQTLTDARWEKFLKIAREQKNSVSAQIAMKLRPANPTPGLDKPTFMLTYTKNESHKQPAYYAVFSGPFCLGDLYQEVDGFYYFEPKGKTGCWPSWILKDIAFKLEALNEAWSQKLEIELSRAPMPKKVSVNIGGQEGEIHAYD